MSDLTDMVLAEMHETAPATARELAASLGISLNTARTVLRALERQGLLESETYQRSEPIYLLP